jgi:outer membrane protein OmpA-like peptidoglycan-associated protein
MKKLLLLILVLAALTVKAQKKKDLIAKITVLEQNILALNDSISVAKRQINISNSKAELANKEAEELRAANATLLQNLTNFSKISKQNTETVNSALSSLNEKEQQLRLISDAFAKNDSTAIAILSQSKQILGPTAKVGAANGSIVVTNSLLSLFESDQSAVISEEGKATVAKIAQLITKNPEREITIEALNITGDFDVSYSQAVAVANELWKINSIPAERLHIVTKDGNFKEGITVRLSPNLAAFYSLAKEKM